jgi:hypothetical protein
VGERTDGAIFGHETAGGDAGHFEAHSNPFRMAARGTGLAADRVGRQRMELAVVVEGPIEAQHTQLAVIEPPHLYAEEIPGGMHDAHTPGWAAGGIGGVDA